jgi:hypothetical protein
VVFRAPEHYFHTTQLVFENLKRKDVSLEVHPPEKKVGTQFEDAVALMRKAIGDRVTVMEG